MQSVSLHGDLAERAHSLLQLVGFHLVRVDRDTRVSGKNKGGGVVMFVNAKWCNSGHIYIKEQRCTRDIELLTVSIRSTCRGSFHMLWQ